jgi:hypothetical protein
LIRKYLICSRHLFLSSAKHDEPGNKVPIVELLLPIKDFWELEELMKSMDYLIASNEDPILVNETVQKIFKKVAPYAVNEKDRIFLYAKASPP